VIVTAAEQLVGTSWTNLQNPVTHLLSQTCSLN